jgi:hypothetical protein
MLLTACGRIGFDASGIRDDADPMDGFDFTDFTVCPSELVTIGSATCGNGLDLTPDVQGRVGAAWVAVPYAITPTTRFAIELQIEIAAAGAVGDGMAIVFQADPRGSAALGQNGGSLGYGAPKAITPSTAVELDTSQNTAFMDPAYTHVGIDRDGSLVSLATAKPGFALSNASFTVWVDYDGQAVSASIAQSPAKPAQPLVAVPEDLARLGGPVWIGLTAATASNSELHRIRRWSLAVSR